MLADNHSSLQVRRPTANARDQILRRAARFEQPSLTEFIQLVDKEAQSLDVDSFGMLRGERIRLRRSRPRLLRQRADAGESAAVLTRLHGAPMYLTSVAGGATSRAGRRAEGRAGGRRAQAQAGCVESAIRAGPAERCTAGGVQDRIAGSAYKPDKNSLEYKALDAAATAANTNAVASACPRGWNSFDTTTIT